VPDVLRNGDDVQQLLDRSKLLGAVEGAERLPGRYRRVAVFGGIYNNWIALEAAVTEAKRREAESVLCLGDLGGFGPHPDRVFDILREHEVKVMRGNYDASVSGGLNDCGCGYTDPRDNHFAQLSYDYTFRNTSSRNREWMNRLPPAFRFRLGDVEVLTCHGSPRRTNEFLWESGTPDGLIRSFLDAAETDLLLATHTGIKWQRRLDDGRGFVNVGVLGRPENDGTTGVWFTMLEGNPDDGSEAARGAGPEAGPGEEPPPGGGWRAEFVPVVYDHERLARDMRHEDLPEEFVESILSGWWTTCLEILPAKERSRGRY
jgi:predicted phosphodiesterase